MNEDGQVYAQLGDPGNRDTLEDRMRLLEAELEESKVRAEERFQRAMEQHYKEAS